MKLDGWDRLSIVLSFVWAGLVCYGWIEATFWLTAHPHVTIGNYFWVYAVTWAVGCVVIWLALRAVAWVVRGFRPERENAGRGRL
jgi:hypothetical protein